METAIDEIADRIYRLSTFVPGAGPAGFTFNQFLVDADQPFLSHCGQRALFASVSTAIATVMPVFRLRWIGFGHVETDECGSLQRWLDAAPDATPAVGRMGRDLWLDDVFERPACALADDDVRDLGGTRMRRLDTPHVPHNREAGMMYEETTGTLF